MIALVEGPKQSVGDILEEPVSASRINCFHSCRLKFFFRYIAKVQKPVSTALHVGKAVHHALQQWSKRRWLGELSDTESIHGDFKEGWKALNEETPWSSSRERRQPSRKKPGDSWKCTCARPLFRWMKSPKL